MAKPKEPVFQFNDAAFEGRLRFNHIKLGDAPMMEESAFLERCKQAHPGAEFLLWDEERAQTERERLNLPDEYDSWATRDDKEWTAAQRFTAQSDILRIAILAADTLPDDENVFEIYADLDFAWDDDARRALGGVEAFVARRVNSGIGEICNAVLGARKQNGTGHEFFKHLLRCLPGTQMWNYDRPLWAQVGSDVIFRALQFGRWPQVTVFPSEVFFPYAMEERGKNKTPDFAQYGKNKLHLATHLWGNAHLGRTPLGNLNLAPLRRNKVKSAAKNAAKKGA